jgi:hypothetical protein
VIYEEREYTIADKPLEQYVVFWQRPHLFKLEPVGSSASDLLQTMHARGPGAASAIIVYSSRASLVLLLHRLES